MNVGKGTVNRRFMQITIDRVGLLVDEVALMQIFFPRYFGFTRSVSFYYCSILIILTPKPLLRTALFWDMTQRRVAISYRRFGITHLSHFQG